MKIFEIIEQLRIERFKITGPKTFEELKKSKEAKDISGPNTEFKDVTTANGVVEAPNDHKWSVIKKFYAFKGDTDTIFCAKAFKIFKNEWFCLGINIKK